MFIFVVTGSFVRVVNCMKVKKKSVVVIMHFRDPKGNNLMFNGVN